MLRAQTSAGRPAARRTFLGSKMMVLDCAGVATGPVLHAVCGKGVGQDMLDAGARHDAGRKGVSLDDDRRLGQDWLDIECLELVPVERAVFGVGAARTEQEAMAEIVFAASIKAHILAHHRAPGFEKAHQPSPMIEVPVTEDHRVDRGQVDLHQLEIV